MSNNNTVCCIFNYSPHYREAIYSVMDEEINCHFYFGENVPGHMKSMEYKSLKGFKYRFKNVIFGSKIVWQCNILRLLLKKYQKYILTVDTASASSWLFILFANIFQKKVYFWTHGMRGNESYLTRLKLKFFFSTSSGLLLYGNYAKDLLIKNGFSEQKLFVINNSLDFKKQILHRKEVKKSTILSDYFGNNNPTVIFIGRLEPGKKLSTLLEMKHRLSNYKNLSVNLLFVGDGTDKSNLQLIAKDYNFTSEVWFYGPCYDEKKICELIYNSDLCVSPGNVGLTAIHSLGYGTPVITHDDFAKQMPEFESISKNRTGDFFKHGDVNDLVNTVNLWLLANPNKTENLIQNCYKVIDSYYNPIFQIQVIKSALKI